MSDATLFDFSSFPSLTTKRLRLRALRLTDAADVLVFRGDPYVQRFNMRPNETIAEAQAGIQEALTEFEQKEGISWAVTRLGEDKVIGSFALHNWSRHHRRAEVGYDLARAEWGQGIATEALRAIVHFGFDRLHLNHIYAGTIADNHESVRLLERLGFQREGTRRQWSWEDDGTFHDGAIYGLLRSDLVG